MSGPESRLLQALSHRISQAHSQLERDCLLVDYAGHLARIGQISESMRLVDSLRAKYRNDIVDVLVARFNLAEGLILHFRNLDSLAEDKIRRAHVISEATGDPVLIAVTAAWLAHMEYLSLRVDSMGLHIRRVLQIASPNNHAALSRVSIVVAVALHASGRIDLAQPWYRAAHFHANREGDEATVSAMMHNMAWLRLANLRQRTFTSDGYAPSGELALLSTESVGNYDEIIGTSSLLSLVPILKAQVLSLLGSYREALQLFEAHLCAATEQEGLLRMKCCFLADQAWCRLQLGDGAGASRDAELANSSILSVTHCDDRASTHSRLADIHGALGNVLMGREHKALAESAWDAHRALQLRILAKVELLAPIRIA